MGNTSRDLLRNGVIRTSPLQSQLLSYMKKELSERKIIFLLILAPNGLYSMEIYGSKTALESVLRILATAKKKFL